MRNVLWAVLPCLALVLAAVPARAQGSASVFSPGSSTAIFSSGGAQTVVNTPIDTSLSIAPFPTTPANSTSWLAQFYHIFSLSGLQTVMGGSSLPSPSSFPSTSYPSGKSLPFTPANNLSPTGFVPISPKNN